MNRFKSIVQAGLALGAIAWFLRPPSTRTSAQLITDMSDAWSFSVKTALGYQSRNPDACNLEIPVINMEGDWLLTYCPYTGIHAIHADQNYVEIGSHEYVEWLWKHYRLTTQK